MTQQELAIKYGVPMPEVCLKLNWQGEAHFYWAYYPYNGEMKGVALCYKTGRENGLDLSFRYCIGNELVRNKMEFIPAPQMNEIADI